MKNILYIGLNGYAGSGKDTVAKMLNFILSHTNLSLEDAWKRYSIICAYDKVATFNTAPSTPDGKVINIAFADFVKKLCSVMFNIDVEKFYYNKSTAWVCINKDYKYTEEKPNPDYIVDAETFYTCHDSYMHTYDKYYMSLREILVYVGTYIMQKSFTKDIFVKQTENEVKKICSRNKDIKCVIFTDVRFPHELDFIHDNYGVMINIKRDSVNQLDNIAEHSFDNTSDIFDYFIDNNSTYFDLFSEVWNLVLENPIFSNETFRLDSHDNSENYIRLVSSEDNRNKYQLITEYGASRIIHDNGTIIAIDPSGGPMIDVNSTIPIRRSNFNGFIETELVETIEIDEITGNTYIYTLLGK